MAIADSLEVIMQSELFIPSTIVISAVLAILAYKMLILKDDEELQKTILEEIVKDEIEEITKVFGSTVEKRVSYGMQPIGKVDSYFSYNQVVDEKLEDQVDDEDSDVDENEVNYLKQDRFYLKIRPDSKAKKFAGKILDDIMGFEKYTEYLVIPKDYVSDGEHIVLSDAWNMTKMGNVWISDNSQGVEFVREQTYKQMASKVLETAEGAVRATNEMNLKFAQIVQEAEALSNLKDESSLSDQIEKFLDGE